MVEKKIQAECIKWFRNEYLDILISDGLIDNEKAKYLRMLFHGNQNELPMFLEKHLSYKGITILKAWVGNLKAMGLMSGVADTSMKIPVFYEGEAFNFVEIEFKTERKGHDQSDRQKLYQEAVKSVGGLYVVIRSIPDFKAFINSLILRV